MDFDQPLGGELREKVEQVRFQSRGVDLVFGKEGVADAIDAGRLL